MDFRINSRSCKSVSRYGVESQAWWKLQLCLCISFLAHCELRRKADLPKRQTFTLTQQKLWSVCRRPHKRPLFSPLPEPKSINPPLDFHLDITACIFTTSCSPNSSIPTSGNIIYQSSTARHPYTAAHSTSPIAQVNVEFVLRK